jgi:CDP-4-dehydro-6-deoxyglucose reductase
VIARILSIDSRPADRQPPDGQPAPVQIIRLHTGADFKFAAGQYLEIIHPDRARIPLSIASPPEQLPLLELHYRSTPGLPEAVLLDELLGTASSLEIEGPHGDVRLQPEDDRSLMLVAGGTGIAQALCLLRAQLLRHPVARVHLLACADSDDDFYYRDLLPVSPRLTTTFVADPARSTGNRALAWIRDNRERFFDPGVGIVLSGGPPFVYAVTDELESMGYQANKLASDVYAYAPRGS